METIWKVLGVFLGLISLQFCDGFPINLENSGTDSHTQLLTGLVAVLLTVCSIVLLAGCLCCDRRKGFKEFRDSPVVASVASNLDHGHVNPIANGEFTIFTPLSPPHFNNIFLANQEVVTRNEEDLKHGDIDVRNWFDGTEAEFPRTKLKYIRELGKGWFGRVVEGTAQDFENEQIWTPVVVRILEASASTKDRVLFLHDANIYRCSPHPNVLSLLGRSLSTTPLLLMQEYCPKGDLKRFLRENQENRELLLSSDLPLRWCCQLSSAVKHLHNQKIVHLDLASRNCMLTENSDLKLGDYGLGMSFYPEDYYLKTFGLSVRWCSPESITYTSTTIQPKPATIEGNIWSLGVTMWEIYECGDQPYSALTDDDVISQVLGPPNVRLPRPTYSILYTDYIFRLMQMCWTSAESRPAISQIDLMLADLMQVYRNTNIGQSKGVSIQDFDQRWENLKPNTIVKTDNHINEDCEDALENISLCNEISNQNNISDSMNNLLQDSCTVQNIEMESWLENLTNTEDLSYVKGVQTAMHYLDNAIALENISSFDSSHRPSPSNVNSKLQLNFKLGPINKSKPPSPLENDSLTDSLLFARRTSSESETEEENWKKKIETGAYSEKVRQKSRSVADLMVLTHIDCSESDSETPLASLDYRVNYRNVRKTSKQNLESMSLMFGSEGNLLSVKDTFEEELRKLKEERKDSLLFVPDTLATHNETKSLPDSSSARKESLSSSENLTLSTEALLQDSPSKRILEELNNPTELTPMKQIYNVFNVTIESKFAPISNLKEIINFKENENDALNDLLKTEYMLEKKNGNKSTTLNNSLAEIGHDSMENTHFQQLNLEVPTKTEVPTLYDLIQNNVKLLDYIITDERLGSVNITENNCTDTENSAIAKETSEIRKPTVNNREETESTNKTVNSQISVQKIECSNLNYEQIDNLNTEQHSNDSEKGTEASLLSQSEDVNTPCNNAIKQKIDSKSNLFENQNETVNISELNNDITFSTTYSKQDEKNLENDLQGGLNFNKLKVQCIQESNDKLETNITHVHDVKLDNTELITQESMKDTEDTIILDTNSQLHSNVDENEKSMKSVLSETKYEDFSIEAVQDNCNSNMDSIKSIPSELNTCNSTTSFETCNELSKENDYLNNVDAEVNLKDQCFSNTLLTSTPLVEKHFENSVILGSCPEYTIDLYKGLKTSLEEKRNKELQCNTNNCLNYSLETWDTFLDDAMDKQEDNNFYNFNSGPQSISFEENGSQETLQTSLNHTHIFNEIYTPQKAVKQHDLEEIINDIADVSVAESTMNKTYEVPKNRTFCIESDDSFDSAKENKDDPSNWASGGGWYLHPQVASEELSGQIDVSPDTNTDSYVGFSMDDEIMSAIRNELIMKLPQAQRLSNDQLLESEEMDSSDKVEVFIKYNAPLSPIPEESYESESNSFQFTPQPSRQDTDDESDWTEPAIGLNDIRGDTETHSPQIPESPEKGPHHRHTPSQDSCCSNDTLFNLEELAANEQDKPDVKELLECEPLQEFETEHTQPSNTEHLNSEYIILENESNSINHDNQDDEVLKLDIENRTDENLELHNNIISEVIDEQNCKNSSTKIIIADSNDEAYNYVADFLRNERLNVHQYKEGNSETTEIFLNTLNKNVAPLPSPEDRQWKELQAPFLTYGAVNESKQGSEHILLLDNTIKDKHTQNNVLTEDCLIKDHSTDAVPEYVNVTKLIINENNCEINSPESSESHHIDVKSSIDNSNQINIIENENIESDEHGSIINSNAENLINKVTTKPINLESSNKFLETHNYTVVDSNIDKSSDLIITESEPIYLDENVGEDLTVKYDDMNVKISTYESPLNIMPAEDDEASKTDILNEADLCDNTNADHSLYVNIMDKYDTDPISLNQTYILTEADDYCNLNSDADIPFYLNINNDNLEPVETVNENKLFLKSDNANLITEAANRIEKPLYINTFNKEETVPIYLDKTEIDNTTHINSKADKPLYDDVEPVYVSGDDLLSVVNVKPLYMNVRNEDEPIYLDKSDVLNETDKYNQKPLYANVTDEEVIEPVYMDTSIVAEGNKYDYVNISTNSDAPLYMNIIEKDNVEPIYLEKSEVIAETNKYDNVYGALSDIRFTGPCDNQLMSTSFSESNDLGDDQDWDSGSDTRSSSSGEFIWKEGEHEESVKALRAAPQDMQTDELAMEDVNEEESTDSGSEEEGETPEFVPSAWDKYAIPMKSSLRSPEKTLEKPDKKSKAVWFKKQKYHCVYEYPKEPEAQNYDMWKPSDEIMNFDFSLDESYFQQINDYNKTYDPVKKPLPEMLENIQTTSLGEDFFISSSTRPFDTMGGLSSEFFPGHCDNWPDLIKLNENVTPDSGIDDLIPTSITDCNEYEPTDQPIKDVEPLKKLAAIVLNGSKNKEVLGGLRHTRNKLKLDLPPSPTAFSANKVFTVEPQEEVVVRSTPTFTTFGKSRFSVQHVDTPTDEKSENFKNVSFEALPHKPIINKQILKKGFDDEEKQKVEVVRGEASLLDSADEDSGIESCTLERKRIESKIK